MDKVTQKLEEAIALEKQGKKEESDKVLADMKKWLEDISNGIGQHDINEKEHSKVLYRMRKRKITWQYRVNTVLQRGCIRTRSFVKLFGKNLYLIIRLLPVYMNLIPANMLDIAQ